MQNQDSVCETLKLLAVPKQGGHWYTQNGDQVQEVLKANGKDYTKPTLRHAKKYNLGPGVTSIIRTLSSPGLNVWKEQQAIMAGATCPRIDGEDDKQWMKRVIWDMNEQSTLAANKGTEIHGALELHMQGKPFNSEFQKHVDGVTDLLAQHCNDGSEWMPEKGISSIFGYGTKADLFNDRWLIDFKTKDGDQEVMDSQKLYENHYMQLAATKACLPVSKAWFETGKYRNAAIVFVSRTHPGACSFVVADNDKLTEGHQLFMAALRVWQIRNQHTPTWQDMVKVQSISSDKVAAKAVDELASESEENV